MKRPRRTCSHANGEVASRKTRSSQRILTREEHSKAVRIEFQRLRRSRRRKGLDIQAPDSSADDEDIVDTDTADGDEDEDDDDGAENESEATNEPSSIGSSDADGEVSEDGKDKQKGRPCYSLRGRNQSNTEPMKECPYPQKRKRIKFSHANPPSHGLLNMCDDDCVPDIDPYQALQSRNFNDIKEVFSKSSGKDGGSTSHDPIQVDTKLTFADIGGLDSCIGALKEMVFFPLVYPEVFKQLRITPPRGVLFHGPPGTGKTLVARALAATASRAGCQVSFFMRKGADILSKWVGESEKGLRMLFEEAKKREPSIIFFDEVDGLAPARSAKSDQIHNSIVATLLALMDGLEDRGQVVVIGATNSIDSLDPALRRPGRFDRELMFPLPDENARMKILEIHTRKWKDPVDAALLKELAVLCVGYGGADLKALCTEASLNALRRCFPQIYESDMKLPVDLRRVKVDRNDFMSAFHTVTPSADRSRTRNTWPLSPVESALLGKPLDHAVDIVCNLFIPARVRRELSGSASEGSEDGIQGLIRSQLQHQIPKPWILVSGNEDDGVKSLVHALLHKMDGIPIHNIGLSDILSEGGRTPQEVLVSRFKEAMSCSPSILFLPQIDKFWDSAGSCTKAVLKEQLWRMPNIPVLLVTTAAVPLESLKSSIIAILGTLKNHKNSIHVKSPGGSQRRALFGVLISRILSPPPPPPTPSVPTRALEAPSDAAALEEVCRREDEEKALQAHKNLKEEQSVLRDLRMCLRKVTIKLIHNRSWADFREPVPAEDVDYWNSVTHPMDLSTILGKVNDGEYLSPEAYLEDIKKIVTSVQEFYHDNRIGGRDDITCAHWLNDEACKLVSLTVPDDVSKKCSAIQRRGGCVNLTNAGEGAAHKPHETPVVIIDQEVEDRVVTRSQKGSNKTILTIPGKLLPPVNGKKIRVPKTGGKGGDVDHGEPFEGAGLGPENSNHVERGTLGPSTSGARNTDTKLAGREAAMMHAFVKATKSCSFRDLMVIYAKLSQLVDKSDSQEARLSSLDKAVREIVQSGRKTENGVTNGQHVRE